MTDLEKLSLRVSAHRQNGRHPFPKTLIDEILEAADSHGRRVVMRHLSIAGSTFYKWLKTYSAEYGKVTEEPKKKATKKPPAKKAKKAGKNIPTTFVEIPKPDHLSNHSSKHIQSSGHDLWEVVRSDGAVLRCYSQRPLDPSQMFHNFLSGGPS